MNPVLSACSRGTVGFWREKQRAPPRVFHALFDWGVFLTIDSSITCCVSRFADPLPPLFWREVIQHPPPPLALLALSPSRPLALSPCPRNGTMPGIPSRSPLRPTPWRAPASRAAPIRVSRLPILPSFPPTSCALRSPSLSPSWFLMPVPTSFLALPFLPCCLCLSSPPSCKHPPPHPRPHLSRLTPSLLRRPACPCDHLPACLVRPQFLRHLRVVVLLILPPSWAFLSATLSFSPPFLLSSFPSSPIPATSPDWVVLALVFIGHRVFLIVDI